MTDWFALALQKAQNEGRNPKLTELIEIGEAMKERAQERARINAKGVIEDFVSMASDALEFADEVEAEGAEIDALRRFYEQVRREVPDYDK